MTTETIFYTDGGHADRTAALERDGDKTTLVVGSQRVPLDLLTRDPGGDILKGVTTNIAVASYALLGLFKQWNRSYGDRISFEVDGRKVIGLFQEHPADKGKNYSHPGVTLLEPTGATTAPPGAPGPATPPAVSTPTSPEPGGASMTDWLLAAGALGVGALLFGAAVKGAGLGEPDAGGNFAMKAAPTLAIVFDPVDQEYAEALRDHLSMARRAGEVAEIRLNSRPDLADIVVPLISQSLVLWWDGPVGQYIMQRRATGDVAVLPVDLHSVSDCGSLSPLQKVPRRGSLESYRFVNEGLTEVAREIRGAIKHLKAA